MRSLESYLRILSGESINFILLYFFFEFVEQITLSGEATTFMYHIILLLKFLLASNEFEDIYMCIIIFYSICIFLIYHVFFSDENTHNSFALQKKKY